MLRHSYQFTINGEHFFVPVIFSSCVQSQNLIMLQHLSDIARSKRINDGNTKKMHWKDFYLQIVVNPRSMLCRAPQFWHKHKHNTVRRFEIRHKLVMDFKLPHFIQRRLKRSFPNC